MNIPASTTSIHAIFTKHLADLEAAGPRVGDYVYRFDNGMCLKVDGLKAAVVGLLQASIFEADETEERCYSHIRNGRGEHTDIISFRLARKLDIEKLQRLLLELEVQDPVEAAA